MAQEPLPPHDPIRPSVWRTKRIQSTVVASFLVWTASNIVSLNQAPRQTPIRLDQKPLAVSSKQFLLKIPLIDAMGPSYAQAHGFNANHVHINRLPNGQYRVTINYSHVELGEYRQASVDFEKKEEAIKAYQDLALGADFFLGEIKKSIHFHNPPEKNKPF